MTERALNLPPSQADGPSLRVLPDARVVGRPGAVGRPVAGARPATAVRPATTTRRPIHVAVAVGVTAGLYAVSLAGVTTLQAGTDARLAAERAPAAAAVDALRTSHDRAEADLARIAAGYEGAVTTYQGLTGGIADNEAALDALGGQVAEVEGAAAALRVPKMARLPSVSSRTVYVSARPATHACTTASGKPC